jgi:alanyl-tRNA synthetase
LRLVDRTFKDRDPEYVKLLASRLTSAVPSAAVLFTSEMADPVSIVLARGLGLSCNCGQVLKAALLQFGLRGGGSPDFAQGEVPAAQTPALRAALLNTLRESAAAHD